MLGTVFVYNFDGKTNFFSALLNPRSFVAMPFKINYINETSGNKKLDPHHIPEFASLFVSRLIYCIDH